MRLKKVLFYQHFGKVNEIRGAHFKTYDFFNHILSIGGYKPYIAFDAGSQWHKELPWHKHFLKMPTLESLSIKPDIFFLNSGKDWLKLSQQITIPKSIPIVSPVNHFKAVNPEHPAFNLLQNKAIRICPSPELYRAVKNHPHTNGPCLYIPNGVYVPSKIKELAKIKNTDVLIIGQKNPSLAKQLYKRISKLNIPVDIIENWIDKTSFQSKIATSKVSVHLPKKVEAHYIPAIESMMLDSLVVMPNCVGNESYAIHQQNCIISECNADELYKSVVHALNMAETDTDLIIKSAKITSHNFSLEQEKRRLKKALDIAVKEW